MRLVFAPEFDAAFIGRDTDNFVYLRYDLDISFFRICENDKPVHLDHYLHWSPTRAKENELISVSGSPGSTQRLLTMAQLEFLRDVDYPTRMEIYKSTDAALKNFSSQSEENARIENNIKRFIGYQEGLHDKQTMDLKAADEPRFRSTPGVSRKRYERFTALMRWLTN